MKANSLLIINMIVENLYWLDYMDVSSLGGQDDANQNERPIHPRLRKSIIAPQFDSDVHAIMSHAGLISLNPGMTITVTLQELLTVSPRKRRRISAYDSLVRHLREQHGVELIITSNKTKLNGKEIV